MQTTPRKPKAAPASNGATTTPQQSPRSVIVKHLERTEIIKSTIVTIKVPAADAALLVKPGYYARICSASISGGIDRERMDEWHKARIMNGKRQLPRKTVLAEILKQELDTELTVYFEGDEWQKIVEFCKRLQISECDWLLTSAHYNAGVLREELASA
jgi:hypothetical protein